MDQPSLFSRLWERKVPQLLGTYLAVGFGVLQFLEFISRRFELGGHWVDGYLILWLLSIPAVAVLIYYGGMPVGAGKTWKRAVVMLNLVVALLLALIVPTGQVAMATQTVTTTQEDGTVTQRIIPAATAIQRIGVFEFTNTTEEASTDWWGTAYSLLLHKGLRQRPELMVANALSLNEWYSTFELPMFQPINLATQRKIAERAKTDYFVRARYEVSPDQHELTGGLYRTRDGKEVQKLAVVESNPFQAADELQRQIESYLPAPLATDQTTTRLPVAALLTDNEAALEGYTKGMISFTRNKGDLPPSVAQLRRSVAADPNCAACVYELGDKLYGQGKTDSSLVLLTRATKLAKMLPEREQFRFKSTLLAINGQFDNYDRLMEAARTLYPYEFGYYSALESRYERNHGVDSAIVLMETAARLSDREAALGRLFNLYLRAKRYEEAEEVIEDLAREFATPEETKKRYAGLYEAQGKIDKARGVLEDLIAIDPTNMELLNRLAYTELNSGNYEAAETLLRDVMERTTNRRDSINAWNQLVTAYAERGRIREALTELSAYERFISREAPVNVILAQNFTTKVIYAARLRDPRPLLKEYQTELARYENSFSQLVRCFQYPYLIFEGHGYEEMNAAMDDCQSVMENTDDAVRAMYEIARLQLDERYAEAADLIDQQVYDGSRNFTLAAYYGRTQRLAGRPDRAAELVDAALTSRPNDPNLLFLRAQVLVDQGRAEEARPALETVLQTWRDADPDHLKAGQARAIAAELGISPPASPLR